MARSSERRLIAGHTPAAVRRRLTAFVDQPAWRSALETLAVGGGAAVLAYILGAALQGVA